MRLGEKIYSSKTDTTYTVFHMLPSGGQAEAAFAVSDSHSGIFFIKRLIDIRYSDKFRLKRKCNQFEKRKRELYEKINSLTLPGGSCPYVYDFFRQGAFYHVVTGKIDGFGLDCQKVARGLSMSDRMLLMKIMIFSIFPLEQNEIVHGDLKPENFLLKRIDNHLSAKMIDLESAFSCQRPPEGEETLIGTDPYLSPELAEFCFGDKKKAMKNLSPKNDIFAMGVIFYEMLSGEYPNAEDGKYAFQIASEREKFRYPEKWSPDLKSLLDSMLDIDPNKRPDVKSVIAAIDRLKDVSAPTDTILRPEVSFDFLPSDEVRMRIDSVQNEAELLYSINSGEFQLYGGPVALPDELDSLQVCVRLSRYGKVPLEEQFPVKIPKLTKGKVSKPVIKVDRKIALITCPTPDAEIRYTLDGTQPTKASELYKYPFVVEDNVRITARAFKFRMEPSEVSSINSSSKVKIK